MLYFKWGAQHNNTSSNDASKYLTLVIKGSLRSATTEKSTRSASLHSFNKKLYDRQTGKHWKAKSSKPCLYSAYIYKKKFSHWFGKLVFFQQSILNKPFKRDQEGVATIGILKRQNVKPNWLAWKRVWASTNSILDNNNNNNNNSRTRLMNLAWVRGSLFISLSARRHKRKNLQKMHIQIEIIN